MGRVSSFSQTVELSRIVWANIFTIDKAKFDTISGVLAALDQHTDLKELHIKSVFENMFQHSFWDETYWRRFITALTPVSSSDAVYLPTVVQ